MLAIWVTDKWKRSNQELCTCVCVYVCESVCARYVRRAHSNNWNEISRFWKSQHRILIFALFHSTFQFINPGVDSFGITWADICERKTDGIKRENKINGFFAKAAINMRRQSQVNGVPRNFASKPFNLLVFKRYWMRWVVEQLMQWALCECAVKLIWCLIAFRRL